MPCAPPQAAREQEALRAELETARAAQKRADERAGAAEEARAAAEAALAAKGEEALARRNHAVEFIATATATALVFLASIILFKFHL